VSVSIVFSAYALYLSPKGCIRPPVDSMRGGRRPTFRASTLRCRPAFATTAPLRDAATGACILPLHRSWYRHGKPLCKYPHNNSLITVDGWCLLANVYSL